MHRRLTVADSLSVDDEFDRLITEGEAVPTAGWDFSWFDGRATEERPSWGYARLAAERIAGAHAVLDIQTGGAEVFAGAIAAAARTPEVVAATESWPPNLAIARDRLAAFGGTVAQSDDGDPLPYPDGSFDLVLSRHPVPGFEPFAEIVRVLEPGGALLAQLIGERTNSELYEFMMGPQPRDPVPRLQRVEVLARAAGLDLTDLREERTRVEFFDVAAIVYFLRKVIWTVPGFTVARYRDRLRAAHEIIQRDGSFVSFSARILIDARRR